MNRFRGSSWGLSAKELIQGMLGVGDGYRMHSTLSYSDHPNTFRGVLDTIGLNFRREAPTQLPIILLTPLAFKAGKRILRKPISLTNKGLKMVGVGRDVKV